MTRPKPHQQRFVEHLGKLASRENPDRAALAALRRVVRVRPGASAEAHRYVVPWIPGEITGRATDVYYLVAGLFATHPANWSTDLDRLWRTNFGASFRRLRDNGGASVERRFVALLNSHPDDLPTHLRHAVSLLRANDVRVDWAQLLADLRQWDHPERYVQRAWARSFWAPTQESDTRAETPGAAAE